MWDLRKPSESVVTLCGQNGRREVSAVLPLMAACLPHQSRQTSSSYTMSPQATPGASLLPRLAICIGAMCVQQRLLQQLTVRMEFYSARDERYSGCRPSFCWGKPFAILGCLHAIATNRCGTCLQGVRS